METCPLLPPMLPASRPLRRTILIVLAVIPVIFGVLALIMGQDSNWDLRNYHWYNAYAALNGRLSFDMGAAQTPTFYNPVVDIPFYLLAERVPARVAAFLLGALQGCNFILLYMLAAKTLRLGSDRRQAAASVAVALVGMVGGGHLALVGVTFYDNVVSLFVFGGLLVVLSSADILQRGALTTAFGRVAFAGFLVGLGVGIKLPTQIFAIGVCFGLLFIPGPFMRRFWLSFVCGLGIVAGFALLGGWWIWELWSTYANPLFPYFNDIFHSPWALPESYRDDRFIPHDLAAALTLPFRMFVDAKVVGEIPFRDARVLVAYVVLIATPIMLVVKRLTKTEIQPFADVFALRYLAAMAGLTYVVWLKLFGIYRYLIPLEMLAPLIVVMCISFWPFARGKRFSLAVGMLGFAVITMQPGNWGHIPWSEKTVEVTAPKIADPAHSLILMTGFAPTSYVIPAFPPEIPFLRPQSFLVAPHHRTRFMDVLRARVAAHTGDIYLLKPKWDTWSAPEVLPEFGLMLASCEPLPTNLDAELEFCLLQRAERVQN